MNLQKPYTKAKKVMEANILKGERDVLRENIYYLKSIMHAAELHLVTSAWEVIESTSDNIEKVEKLAKFLRKYPSVVFDEKFRKQYVHYQGIYCGTVVLIHCYLSESLLLIQNDIPNTRLPKYQNLFDLLDLSAVIHFLKNGTNLKYYIDYKKSIYDRDQLVDALSSSRSSTYLILFSVKMKWLAGDEVKTMPYSKVEDTVLNELRRKFGTVLYRIRKGIFGFLSQKPVLEIYNEMLDLTANCASESMCSLQSVISQMLDNPIKTLCIAEIKLEKISFDEIVIIQNEDIATDDTYRGKLTAVVTSMYD